ncbi:MAG TPA: hypothetical protein VF695_12675 [Sphingomonas sp.]
MTQDVLWLPIAIFAFRSRSRLEGLGNMSREHFAVETVLLENASRDIVSRLVALDDDGRTNRSFQTLFASMKREGLEAARTRSLDRLVKEFRQTVNGLKVSHRNNYIAHVDTAAEVKPRVLDDPVDFSMAASLAVNLLDDISGRKIPYFFKLGSNDLIDLRKALTA